MEEKINIIKISFDSEENKKIILEKVFGREEEFEEYEEFFCLYDGENSNYWLSKIFKQICSFWI